MNYTLEAERYIKIFTKLGLKKIETGNPDLLYYRQVVKETGLCSAKGGIHIDMKSGKIIYLTYGSNRCYRKTIKKLIPKTYDSLGVYPYPIKVIVPLDEYVKNKYMMYESAGIHTLDFLYGSREEPSRQLRYGRLFIVYPENYLMPDDLPSLNQIIVDLHNSRKFTIRECVIVTKSPFLLTDYPDDIIHALKRENNESETD